MAWCQLATSRRPGQRLGQHPAPLGRGLVFPPVSPVAKLCQQLAEDRRAGLDFAEAWPAALCALPAEDRREWLEALEQTRGDGRLRIAVRRRAALSGRLPPSVAIRSARSLLMSRMPGSAFARLATTPSRPTSGRLRGIAAAPASARRTVGDSPPRTSSRRAGGAGVLLPHRISDSATGAGLTTETSPRTQRTRTQLERPSPAA